MNWLIYAILGIVLVGIFPVFAKNGMRKCSSNLAAAIYGTAFFIAVNCMLSFMDISLNLAQTGQTVFAYLLFSGLSIGMMCLSLFRALKLWKINNVIPIAKASLVLEILVGIFVLGDEIVPAIVINWGAFIQAVINFLLTAIVLFTIFKIVSCILKYLQKIF